MTPNTDNQILPPDVAAKTDPNLPPPGAARDELLARRQDTLDEQIDKLSDNVGKIPESAFEPDREILNDVENGHLNIGANHAYYKTKWVNYVHQHGSKVWEAKNSGWRVATAVEFPEAKDLVREDNTIRVGDVLLMFIRIDKYQQILFREEQKRLRQQYGLDADVVNLADKNPEIFRNVSISGQNMDPQLESRMQTKAARATAAKKLARKSLGNKMKEGLVPGIPLK